MGEGHEARAAFFTLAERPVWREDALVRRFAREIAPVIGAESLDALLAPQGEHGIPEAVWKRVSETFRT